MATTETLVLLEHLLTLFVFSACSRLADTLRSMRQRCVSPLLLDITEMQGVRCFLGPWLNHNSFQSTPTLQNKQKLQTRHTSFCACCKSHPILHVRSVTSLPTNTSGGVNKRHAAVSLLLLLLPRTSLPLNRNKCHPTRIIS